MKTISVEDLQVRLDGVTYHWVGGFGCVLRSYERGVSQGSIRMIGHVLFYAYLVERVGWHRGISWVPTFEFDAAWIREFKAALCGL